ncbi:hypothetical protein EKK58_04350 [Candidatus Dependentiae bacterium]|nr:MAG: hypothetical protein EKK58_04350 [Candidatus Dependentiae bacterium]
MERKTLMQQNEVQQISEYGWKNLNILRLKPSKEYSVGDTEIQFQLDSSLLASNVPINRIQMEIDYEVTVTSLPADGDYTGGLSGIPVYGGSQITSSGSACPWTKYPIVFPANTSYNSAFVAGANTNNKTFAPYLTSPSNGGLDYLVGNKSFSNVKIKSGANEIRDDKRTPEKMDIMARLLSDEKLIKEGIYPDYIKGSILDKAGGDVELLNLVQLPPLDDAAWATNATYDGELSYGQTYARGCSPQETMNKNLFWKRNTNGQYIEYGRTYFRKPTVNGSVFVEGVDPDDDTLTNPYAPIRFIYKRTPKLNEDGNEYWYQVIPNATYFEQQIQQKTEMKVFEDLMSDILMTRYNRNENYRPLPSSQLNFTFSISPLLKNLYKTSNLNIQSVEVVIKSMHLNVFTFNYGYLNIEPTTYYIPYYQEKSDVQPVTLILDDNNDPEPTTTAELQTLKYNKMPSYVLLYASENFNNGVLGSQHQNLNSIEMQRIRLTLNNDHGSALYSMTIKELKDATVKNFGKDFSNFYNIFRSNEGNLCEGVWEAVEAWSINDFPYQPSASVTNWYMNPNIWNQLTSRMAQTPAQSIMDGVYLLKIGEDIRIDPTLCPSMNTPISMTWDIDFGTNFYADTSLTINFNSVALFPAYYIMNPQQGLIKQQDLSISMDEFWMMVKNTNTEIEESKTKQNVYFNTEYPNMMFGSGWFSNIISGVKSALPFVKTGADAVGKVAQYIPLPQAQAIGMASKAISKGAEALGGKKRKPAPKRKTIKK